MKIKDSIFLKDGIFYYGDKKIPFATPFFHTPLNYHINNIDPNFHKIDFLQFDNMGKM